MTPSSRRSMAKKQHVYNVEGTRIVVLETKWEVTTTYIIKVHDIPPVKSAVDDKFYLLTS
jgi:hypothetical protein